MPQVGWSAGQRILNDAGAREPEHRLDPPVPVTARIVGGRRRGIHRDRSRRMERPTRLRPCARSAVSAYVGLVSRRGRQAARVSLRAPRCGCRRRTTPSHDDIPAHRRDRRPRRRGNLHGALAGQRRRASPLAASARQGQLVHRPADSSVRHPLTARRVPIAATSTTFTMRCPRELFFTTALPTCLGEIRIPQRCVLRPD